MKPKVTSRRDETAGKAIAVLEDPKSPSFLRVRILIQYLSEDSSEEEGEIRISKSSLDEEGIRGPIDRITSSRRRKWIMMVNGGF